MTRTTIGLFLGAILAACSSNNATPNGGGSQTGSDPSAGLCSKLGDCARKTMETFDEASCKSELKGYRDTASSKSCASQFDDAINCLTGVQCGATDAQIDAACASKISALEAACSKGGDGGGGGSVLPPGGGGGGMDQCTATSKCPNDLPKTQEMIDMCKMNSTMQQTKCPSEAKAFGMCFWNNWTCDADGKTDVFATIGKCQAEQDALFKCVG